MLIARAERAGPLLSASHSPRAEEQLKPRKSIASTATEMAKEGTETAEETEQMIERNGAKEPESTVNAPDSKEMRAVLLSGFGGLNKLKVTKKTMPEPQEGEVKIRVKAWYSMFNHAFFPPSFFFVFKPDL